MKNKYSVLQTFIRICSDQLSRSGVNFLIELAHNYSYKYLKYRFQSLGKVLMAEDITLDELAIEAIASLFERDDFGLFIKPTKKCFLNLPATIETHCIF